MSSILTCQCEVCKKVVEEQELSFDTEGFEVCPSCKRQANREAEAELDELDSQEKD
jgi:NAD-dependent SIR2 family protein deacetylase